MLYKTNVKLQDSHREKFNELLTQTNLSSTELLRLLGASSNFKCEGEEICYSSNSLIDDEKEAEKTYLMHREDLEFAIQSTFSFKIVSKMLKVLIYKLEIPIEEISEKTGFDVERLTKCLNNAYWRPSEEVTKGISAFYEKEVKKRNFILEIK